MGYVALAAGIHPKATSYARFDRYRLTRNSNGDEYISLNPHGRLDQRLARRVGECRSKTLKNLM
jgi:hypothetical protein